MTALAFAGPAAASDPSFVRAFGKGVNSSDSSDVCTTASGCQGGGTGGGAGQLNGPTGVAVAGSGDVYVADSNNNRIDEYSQAGGFVRAFGKDVGGSGVDVCTTSCNSGSTGGGAGQLHNPTGVAVAGSGDVYVVDQSNQRIDEYSQTGSFVRAFGKDVGGAGVDVCTTSCQAGSQGAGAGQLSNPFGVAVSGAGDVYVAEQSNQRIAEYSQSGSFVRAFGKGVGGSGVDVCTTSCQAGSQGGGAGQLDTPVAVAVAGDVYVADGNNRVAEYGQSGSFVRAFGKGVGGSGVDVCTTSCVAGSAGGGAGQLNNPRGVAVAGSGDVYVADTGNNRVAEYGQSGSFVRAFGKDVGGSGVDVCTTSCVAGSFGGGAGQLANPFGVAVAGSGDVYVADNSNTRIDEYGPATVMPTLSTSASSAQVGSPISDTATLTGGNSPTGTITFKAYDNSSCSGTPAFEADNVAVASASASSGHFTPTAAGSYYWTASYSGDAGNDPVSSACNIDPNETSTVSAAKPSNMSLPSIASTGKVGDHVTCNPGTWTGSPSSFGYSWTIDSSIIAGQHASTYKLAAGDAGHKIRCQVVAHNSAGDSAPATSNALSVAKPKSACNDTIRPTSKIASSQLKNGKLSLSGRASDKPCNGKPGHVVRVVVTISRHIGNRCLFLLENGHGFGPLRRCDGAPPIVFPAKGTSKWSLKQPAVLPAGRYTIRSRPTDAAGNVQAVHRRGPNVLVLRVK